MTESTEHKHKRGLLLTGGGTKGAFQAGALKYLILEKKRRYDAVAGFSIGALNGAGVAQGDLSMVMDLWENAKSISNFFGGNWAFYKGLLSMKPLRKHLIDRLDIDKLRASPVEFYFSTVDLQKGILIEIDKHKSPLIDWLLASCSIPGVFEPVEIDGHQFVDGGVLATNPLAPLIHAGADEIDVITCRPIYDRSTGKKVETIIETAQRCLELIQSEMVRLDIDRCRQMTETIINWGHMKGGVNIIEGFVLNLAEKRENFPLSHYREVKVNIVEPSEDIIDILEFDADKIKAAMTAGYDEAKRVFDALESLPEVE